MKNLKITLLAAAAFTMGGCAQVQQAFTDITGDAPTVQNIIGDASKLCGFVLDQPAAEALVTAAVGTTGYSIAEAVCSVAGNIKVGAAEGSQKASFSVKGVPVTGTFVK